MAANKIILVVSSMNCGGAERVAATLVNSWAAQGRDVCLIIAYRKKEHSFYEIAKNVEVVYLADLVPFSRLMPYLYFKRLLALRRLITLHKPDFVISFLSNVNVMTLLATKWQRVKVISSEHITPLNAPEVGFLLNTIRRLTYPWASAITLLGDDMVAAFCNMVPGVRHIEVIPNPISDEIKMIKRSYAVPTKRYRLVAAGRFADQKKFDTLVHCFAELAYGFPDWDLTIFGDGPLRENIAGLVAKLDLGTRISLPGQSTELWQELINADVFVLSSLYEGFPMVLLEAMALGLPCVAFDCPSGPKEMLLNGDVGLLVPHQNKVAMITALRTIMLDKELRDNMGAKAFASVWERYSIDVVLERWDILFAKIDDVH